MSHQDYQAELETLQVALVRTQAAAMKSGERIVLVLEGRDGAGKDGSIKRITEHLSVRQTRTVALPKPSDRERTQWYFQRYMAHLPAAGEFVIFNRSWYNRAGVEVVMGFSTPEEQAIFLRDTPDFERMLVEDGIVLLKYWFSVSDVEQEARFRSRSEDPMRRWKLSPNDVLSITKWEDYSRAKDTMFIHTDIPEAPWWIVEAVDKRRARLNCIRHFLGQIPYEDAPKPPVVLPDRVRHADYIRTPIPQHMFVPPAY